MGRKFAAFGLRATSFAAVTLLTIGLLGCWADLRTFSEGDRTGLITKLSFRSTYEAPKIREGCMNWEGELAMANSKIVRTGGDEPTETGGNTFEFSLPKRSQDAQYSTSEQDVQRALHDALISQHRVLLHYIQVARHDKCASRTDYLVVGVQDLGVQDLGIQSPDQNKGPRDANSPDRPAIAGRVALADGP